MLEPTVTKIRDGLDLAKQYNVSKEVEDYDLASQGHVISVISRFVAEHSADVRLLLFKGLGSSLEGFKYEVLDAFTDNMQNWARSIKPENEVSRLFVRSVCSFYLSLIEQVFLYRNSSEMDIFLKEITVFVYHGWKSVLS